MSLPADLASESAGSAVLARPRRVRAVEAVEDRTSLLGRNPRPVILHRKQHTVATRADDKPHEPVRDRVLDLDEPGLVQG